MELTKQDFEDLAAPAIEVKQAAPVFTAKIDRDRLLALTRGMYPDESEGFTDDEIVTLLQFYGTPKETNATLIARVGLHLDDVKGKRAQMLPGDKPAQNDPIIMTDKVPPKTPIGKKP